MDNHRGSYLRCDGKSFRHDNRYQKHYADFVVDHLFVIGDAIWSGWGFANSTVLLPDEDGICKATLYLEADKGFKLMAESDFNGYQLRAGNEDVVWRMVLLLRCFLLR